jgi:hypothetical protein
MVKPEAISSTTRANALLRRSRLRSMGPSCENTIVTGTSGGQARLATRTEGMARDSRQAG